MIGGEWEPHRLYRLHDRAGRLLYVGITGNLCRRLREHQRRAPWWPEVATGTAEQHADWFRAGSAERLAITEEHPIHNRTRAPRQSKTGAPGAPLVPSVSGDKAPQKTVLDLHGYLRVPEGALKIPVSNTSKTRIRAWGTTFPSSPQNGHPGHPMRPGHSGHCHYCAAPQARP